MVYTHTMKYSSAMKNDEILPSVTTWIDPESITLSEISQTKKDKNRMISLTCGTENRKQQTKQRNSRAQTMEGKWVKYMVMGNLTLAGEHAVESTDDVS